VSHGVRPLREIVYLVLARRGILQIVECPRSQVFEIARARDAGICGVFENRLEAEVFITAIDILPACMQQTRLT
jgi:hypothetical protein